MFNFRASGIASLAGFIISLLLGLLSGVSFPILLMRAFIFAVLFFALAAFIHFLAGRFLSGLMEKDPGKKEGSLPGSRVNITEEDQNMDVQGFPPMPMAPPGKDAALADDSEENLGDIGSFVNAQAAAAIARSGVQDGMFDLFDEDSAPSQDAPPSSGVDQKTGDGYTNTGGVESFAGEGRSDGSDGSMDILPDLDSLAGAFSAVPGEEKAEKADFSAHEAAKRPSFSAKGQKIEGDFDPKELAEGIRTILKKTE